jgi:hypothetical protein
VSEAPGTKELKEPLGVLDHLQLGGSLVIAARLRPFDLDLAPPRVRPEKTTHG